MKPNGDRKPYPVQRRDDTGSGSGGMTSNMRHGCRLEFDAAVEAMRAGDNTPLERWARIYGEAVRDMIWSA